MIVIALYSNEHLKELLQECFLDKKFKDANTILCIPSIEHHKAEPKVYKPPHPAPESQKGIRRRQKRGLLTSWYEADKRRMRKGHLLKFLSYFFKQWQFYDQFLRKWDNPLIYEVRGILNNFCSHSLA